MTRTAEDIVRAEVHYCVSSLVSTLAKHDGQSLDLNPRDDLAELTEQAFDLACPIDDWEEAAREAGWKTADLTPGLVIREFTDRPEAETADDWQEACALSDVEPYQREVYEHWIVSDWLADRLAEKGEKVDKDFAGMTVWARTTTGQAIYMDSVIEAIHADLMREYGE